MVRRPFWVGTNFSVAINGQLVAPESLRGSPELPGRRGAPEAMPKISTFIELKREWRNGDQVKINLPKTLRLEPLPDNPRRVAFMWGPLVLAGDLGVEGSRRQVTQDARAGVHRRRTAGG